MIKRVILGRYTTDWFNKYKQEEKEAEKHNETIEQNWVRTACEKQASHIVYAPLKQKSKNRL